MLTSPVFVSGFLWLPTALITHPVDLFTRWPEPRRAGEAPAGASACAPNGSAPVAGERGLVRRGAYPALPPGTPPASAGGI